MSEKLFVIACNGSDRYRIRKTTTNHDLGRREVILDRLGQNGWMRVETEAAKNITEEDEAIKRLFHRIAPMYGSPWPTKVILYKDMGSINIDRFKERYGLEQSGRDVEIDYTEVELLNDE